MFSTEVQKMFSGNKIIMFEYFFESLTDRLSKLFTKLPYAH